MIWKKSNVYKRKKNEVNRPSFITKYNRIYRRRRQCCRLPFSASNYMCTACIIYIIILLLNIKVERATECKNPENACFAYMSDFFFLCEHKIETTYIFMSIQRWWDFYSIVIIYLFSIVYELIQSVSLNYLHRVWYFILIQ